MATLIICPDIECEIFIDTEFHGIARVNANYRIDLEQGVYWVECRSTEYPSLSYDFDYKAISKQEETCIKVILLTELRHRELKAKYDFISDFQNGFAEVRHKGNLVGYVDENFIFCYDDVSLLCDNVLRVRSNGKYGAINFNKKEIVPIKYDEIILLGDATLRLKLNNRYCLSNSAGLKITALKYFDIVDVKNNTFALYFDKWMFVDSQGDLISVIPNNVMLYTYKSISNLTASNIKENLLIYNYNITKINAKAFIGCKHLTSIVIPYSVTTIEPRCFSGCINLVKFGGKFSSDNGRCLIANNTLIAYAQGSGCEYIIPKDVTKIGKYAFFLCMNLTSIVIPDSVIKIEPLAFSYCI